MSLEEAMRFLVLQAKYSSKELEAARLAKLSGSWATIQSLTREEATAFHADVEKAASVLRHALQERTRVEAAEQKLRQEEQERETIVKAQQEAEALERRRILQEQQIEAERKQAILQAEKRAQLNRKAAKERATAERRARLNEALAQRKTRRIQAAELRKVRRNAVLAERQKWEEAHPKLGQQRRSLYTAQPLNLNSFSGQQSLTPRVTRSAVKPLMQRSVSRGTAFISVAILLLIMAITGSIINGAIDRANERAQVQQDSEQSLPSLPEGSYYSADHAFIIANGTCQSVNGCWKWAIFPTTDCTAGVATVHMQDDDGTSRGSRDFNFSIVDESSEIQMDAPSENALIAHLEAVCTE